MRFGVSYFGVRHPQHMQTDLEDIARLGFDYVVLTFSENDHRFYQGSMASCVHMARQLGLGVWVDPWGVGGVFGGEAFTDRGAWEHEAQQRRSDGRPLPLLCPNAPQLRTYLRQWITTVAEVLQADAIFWDEPHFYLPFGAAKQQGLWSCCCPRCQTDFMARYGYAMPPEETHDVQQWKHTVMAALLEDITAISADHGLDNVVCVLPDHDQPQAIQPRLHHIAANPHLQVLSTDPYPLWHRQPIQTTAVFCDALLQACQATGKSAQMWIQGFCVAAGQEGRLGEEMRLMADCGIRDIAIWSYLGTAYMSSHACADSARVWEVFTQTMQALHRQENASGNG